MALDVPQRGERIREIEKIGALFRVGCEKLPADLDFPPVIRQPTVDLAQVDILLTEIVEVVAEQNLVVVIIRRPGDGSLLLLHGFLKRGDRLEVVSQLVMKETQGVEASPQRSVMPCLVGLRLDELFENVDGHLKRGKRLVILMGPVLDIGDDLIGFPEVFSEPGDRWVCGGELGPVLERFLAGIRGPVSNWRFSM